MTARSGSRQYSEFLPRKCWCTQSIPLAVRQMNLQLAAHQRYALQTIHVMRLAGHIYPKSLRRQKTVSSVSVSMKYDRRNVRHVLCWTKFLFIQIKNTYCIIRKSDHTVSNQTTELSRTYKLTLIHQLLRMFTLICKKLNRTNHNKCLLLQSLFLMFLNDLQDARLCGSRRSSLFAISH